MAETTLVLTPVEKLRLDALRTHIKRVGSIAKLASIYGLNSSYISQIAGHAPKRSVGDQAARNIEEKLGLTPFSLDLPPTDLPVTTLSPRVARVAELLTALSDESLDLALALVSVLHEREALRRHKDSGADIDLSKMNSSI